MHEQTAHTMFPTMNWCASFTAAIYRIHC